MATHHLEYVEPDLLSGMFRAVCSCNTAVETESEESARTWHAEHVQREADKLRRRVRG